MYTVGELQYHVKDDARFDVLQLAAEHARGLSREEPGYPFGVWREAGDPDDGCLAVAWNGELFWK